MNNFEFKNPTKIIFGKEHLVEAIFWETSTASTRNAWFGGVAGARRMQSMVRRVQSTERPAAGAAAVGG